MTEKKQGLTEERVRDIVREEIAKYLQEMLGKEEVRQLNAEVTALYSPSMMKYLEGVRP